MTSRFEYFSKKTKELVSKKIKCIFSKKAKYITLSAFLAMASISFPYQSQAEGFAVQNWSGRGTALNGGLIARGGDASAVAYNPAAITELEGTQLMVGSGFTMPANEIFFKDGTSQNSDFIFLVSPHMYLTHKWNDQVSFGLALFSRFGMTNKYPKNWAGNENVYEVELTTYSLNPVVAWKMSDTLSFAAGVEFIGASMHLKNVGKLPGVEIDHELKNDDIAFAPALNIAAHYRPNKYLAFGLTYRTDASLKINGTSKYTPNAPALDPIFVDRSGRTTLHLPSQTKFAIAYYPMSNLSFEAVVGYYNWSVYKDLDLIYDDGGRPPLPGVEMSPKNWKDTWFYSLSVEYSVLDWLTLRAGISTETSPVPSGYAEYLAPTNGRWNYSAGFGINKGNWAFDLGYIYHDMKDLSFTSSQIPSISGTDGSTSRNVHAHALNASFTYKF